MNVKTMQWPLSRKIFGLALLNVGLIALALAIFAQHEFGLSAQSLLLGPAQDRVMAVGSAVGRDLDARPYSSRQAVLAEYSQRYGVDFYLVSPEGESLSGAEVDLPQAVRERVRGAGAPGPPPGFPPQKGMRKGAPKGGPRPDRTFLVVTRNPLLFWVGVRMPTNGPDGERGIPAVLLLRADSLLNPRLFFDWRAVLLLVMSLAAIAVLCWWPFLHGITRSIGQMDRATEEIARGRFSRHVTLRRRDEVGHLGDQINRMAEQLEGFVKNQKRFLGDIAHELSAPIARIQFALGILEQRLDEPQQKHLEVLRDEIQEMSGLVNELLMFSKAGVVTSDVPLKCVELAPAVQRAVDHQVSGPETIEVTVAPGLSAMGYEPYVVRALSNLLRNALRYAGQEGPIRVIAHREGERVLLSVTDCGPGLPPGSHDDVWAPFYRPETARSRETGGAGLGLAIVKSCVEACQGTVACRNREPSGLEVTISLAACDGG